MIEIVTATRMGEQEFREQSALGLSLRRMAFDKRIVVHVSFANRLGLPEIYNQRIAAPDDVEALVFMHDDVWLDDYFFVDRVLEGLRQFDVIGVAGNRRRLPGQPAWPFADERFTWDDRSNLSGVVGHGKNPFGPVSFFGPVPAECELVDGLFIAARKEALRAKEVRFDPRFDFHFYDLDFCRTVRAQGLRLGTWPIAMTHQSTGSLGSQAWRVKYEEYLEKWGR